MLSLAASLCLLAAEPLVLAPDAEVSQGVADDRGVVVHKVTSPFQKGQTTIQVLLPDEIGEAGLLGVLYLLPVEAGDGQVWGNALDEVRRHDLHTRHQWLCVYPTFSHVPWYADHPTDPTIRQERYLLEVVLPFVDQTYLPGRSPQQSRRLLVGFSKSGWGAFSLILRHPELFQRAAAWDAPLMQPRPDRFGMGPIFGTHQNFLEYQVSRLLAAPAESFSPSPRLIHMGYDKFRDHHQRAEQLLVEKKVAHLYRDGPQRRHHWNSGWLADALDLLARER